MAVIFLALTLMLPSSNPLPGCALERPVIFRNNISDIPGVIRSAFEAKTGHIFPKTESNVTTSDAPARGEKIGKKISYIARSNNQWFISYIEGGVAVKRVTVSFLSVGTNGNKPPFLIGALEGDECTVLNAFLKGVSVAPGWGR